MANAEKSFVTKMVLAEDGKTWIEAPPREYPIVEWAPSVQAIFDSMKDVPEDAQPMFFDEMTMTPSMLTHYERALREIA